MPAYLIVDCEVTDPERYEIYKQLAPPAIAKYGGRYLVRGGAMTLLEGNWRPNRVVVLEFPDEETAKRFYASPEYDAAREKRAGAANMNIVLVPGVSA
jgi:uncharacterized protein (DUF1330 family)